MIFHMVPLFGAEYRLICQRGDTLVITRVGGDGKILESQNCLPKLPRAARCYFNHHSPIGTLIVEGETNTVNQSAAEVAKALNTKYDLNLLAIPSAFSIDKVSYKVSYATRNVSGELVTVVVGDEGPLLILDNQLKVLHFFSERGIQPPSWSSKSNCLAFYQRPNIDEAQKAGMGVNAEDFLDQIKGWDFFGVKLLKVKSKDIEVIQVEKPKLSPMPGSITREPPVWKKGEDLFWAYTEGEFHPMLFQVEGKDVIKQKPPVGWLPLVPGLANDKELERFVIPKKGPFKREVILALSPNLLLTQDPEIPTGKADPKTGHLTGEPRPLYITQLDGKDTGRLEEGVYWLISSRL